MKRHLLLVVLFISLLSGLSAAEGLFQINTVFQGSTYPLFGSGGKDVIRVSSAGIGLKSTRGDGFQGIIDLSVLFPYKISEKIYPAKDFSPRTITGFPIGLDALVGFGYRFNLEPLAFFLGTGFHTGALLEGGDSLVAFGLGFDAQAYVKMTQSLTAQVGLKFAIDFGGIQTFVPGSNQFAGFPLSLALYTGIGLAY